MSAPNSSDEALGIVGALMDDSQRSGSILTQDQCIEIAKVYAMLAQAEAQDKMTQAIWGLGDPIERAGRNG